MFLVTSFLLSFSLSYEEGHPSHSETDLLQRQTFAASHQLPGYATTPQATGKNALIKRIWLHLVIKKKNQSSHIGL